MVTIFEKIRWKLFELKSFILFSYGAEKGLIRNYEGSVIERAKKIRCGGVPLSILLLERSLTEGKCYNRAALLTLCFPDDNFKVVTAAIDNLKYNTFYIKQFKNGEIGKEYSYHCFVEKTMEDGSVWVYDTSNGLAYEKSLYYRMQKPKIVEQKCKDEALEYLRKVFKINRKKQNEKSVRNMIHHLERNLSPIQSSYCIVLQEELKKLRGKLNEEVEENHSFRAAKKLILTRNEDD